ncbi:ABC transporter ATP-binding protein [Aeromicrobium sp. CTD01-1L150]|uniref:ABC transporter ATP-binding protein n=1 Tax=Aeromicrobium sp. CTD01-1L150 TaxID=3341830 RepID=UPI0035BEF666
MTTRTSNTTGTASLQVESLQKTYGSGPDAVRAIADLSFAARTGELLCIVGPSGAGKTTLLKCISGLLAPTGGVVRIAGRKVTGPPEGLGIVFQEYGRSLFPWLTVEKNVELPLREKGVTRAVRRRLVTESLDAVGLGDSRDAHPWQLSGGMQQRVAIARAVAYEPQVLVMDEPFAAVDAQTRADLEDLVRSLWSRLGVTVLFVTHDIDEAVYLGERVLVLSRRPTVLMEDVAIDLPIERDQVTTRSDARFAALRTHVYELIRATQQASPDASAADASARG